MVLRLGICREQVRELLFGGPQTQLMENPVYWSPWLLQSQRLSSVSRSHLGASIFNKSASGLACLPKSPFLSHWKVQCLLGWEHALISDSIAALPLALIPAVISFSGKASRKLYYPWSTSLTLLSRYVTCTMESSPALGLRSLLHLSQDSPKAMSTGAVPDWIKWKGTDIKGGKQKPEVF